MSCHSFGANALEQMSLQEGIHPVWGKEPRNKNQELHDQGLPLMLIDFGSSNKDINSVALNSPVKRGRVGVEGHGQLLQSTGV